MADAAFKILFVEDEPILRRATAKIMSSLGAVVTTANDGLEGLARLKEDDFDIIVSDIAMPNMNGLEFLRAARNINFNKPFIFLTGYSGPEFEKEAIAFGIFAYLGKPYRRATHEPVILKALKQSREAVDAS